MVKVRCELVCLIHMLVEFGRARFNDPVEPLGLCPQLVVRVVHGSLIREAERGVNELVCCKVLPDCRRLSLKPAAAGLQPGDKLSRRSGESRRHRFNLSVHL